MAQKRGKKLITPLIFNDEPVSRAETAYFQFEHYADTFARIIAARDTRTPLTIGVHGEWGSGKTTLMRRRRRPPAILENWKHKGRLCCSWRPFVSCPTTRWGYERREK